MLVSKKLGQTVSTQEEIAQVNQAPRTIVRSLLDESIELDAIERLKSNILMLEDLQSRLRFMNNELESLIGFKKKKS